MSFVILFFIDIFYILIALNCVKRVTHMKAAGGSKEEDM